MTQLGFDPGSLAIDGTCQLPGSVAQDLPGICLAGLYQVGHFVELHIMADEIHSSGRGIVSNHRSEPRHLSGKANGTKTRGCQALQHSQAFLLGVSRAPRSHQYLHSLLCSPRLPHTPSYSSPLPGAFLPPPTGLQGCHLFYAQASPHRSPPQWLFEAGFQGPGLPPLSIQPCPPLAPTSPPPPSAPPFHPAP